MYLPLALLFEAIRVPCQDEEDPGSICMLAPLPLFISIPVGVGVEEGVGSEEMLVEFWSDDELFGVFGVLDPQPAANSATTGKTNNIFLPLNPDTKFCLFIFFKLIFPIIALYGLGRNNAC
jgi:hypothetical protein